MNNVTRRQFLSFSAALAAGALAGCGSSNTADNKSDASSSSNEAAYALVNEGKLTVAYSNGFPPMEFSTDDGADTQGFDIDLIKVIAERLGLECEILPTQKFDTLVPTIKAGGKADVCISAVTINDERLAEIDFTDPYLNSNQALLALNTSSFESLDDFNVEGVTLAVSAGTTGDTWGKENFTKATIKSLDDYVSCFTGCETGLYDGVIADLPVAQYLCENSYKDLKVCAEVPTGEQYGIVVSKDNPKLTEAINEALAEIESDGTMDDLKMTWFGTTEGL